VLAELANDEEEYVRFYVAENPSTPKEVLTKLSWDKKSIVRFHVINNPSTPKKVIAKLTKERVVRRVRIGVFGLICFAVLFVPVLWMGALWISGVIMVSCIALVFVAASRGWGRFGSRAQ